MSTARGFEALVFDFNGTLSLDEHILADVWCELFSELSIPLERDVYFDELAGHSDQEIVRRLLGGEHPASDDVLRERIARYESLVADGSTISPETRTAVKHAAERVPVALCTGAFAREVRPVLEAAGLDRTFRSIVTAEDVGELKPSPACYLLTLELLGSIAPDRVVAFEDTEAGITAAKGAGLCCTGVRGTMPDGRLRHADFLVDRINIESIAGFLE
jgi:HAD superfamily hydrolase (TIGR01509 family)